MTRPAEFVRDEVLHRAMETFWRQGYKATSMKDLTRATGLQPGSLYGAFKSKRSLFLEALETYYQFNMNGLEERLSRTGSPIDRIQGVFERIIEASTTDPDNKGCMMVNTLLETPAVDKEINHRLREMFKSVESRLKEVIIDAQNSGHIDKTKDPELLAQAVLTGMHGMRVLCRTQPHPDVLHNCMNSLLSVLSDKPVMATSG